MREQGIKEKYFTRGVKRQDNEKKANWREREGLKVC